jgi:hypothetical protein
MRQHGIKDLGGSSHHKHQTAPNNVSAAHERDFAQGRPLIAIVIQRKWYIGFITSINCVPSARKNLLKAGVIFAAFRIFTQRKPNHNQLLTRAAPAGTRKGLKRMFISLFG